MWWIKAALLSGLCGTAGLFAQPVACPVTLPVSERATAPEGWKSEEKTQTRALLRLSVFNVDAKGTEFDLAPDASKSTPAGTEQAWILSGYRDMKLVVRCHYRNTEATITRELPATLKECRQTIQLDAKGTILKIATAGCR